MKAMNDYELLGYMGMAIKIAVRDLEGGSKFLHDHALRGLRAALAEYNLHDEEKEARIQAMRTKEAMS